jgi:UDP-glucose 4-epimerase
MRTILVTGGTGFIGSYVVEELLARGYDVEILDSRSNVDAVYGVKHIFGDVRDAVLVHQAAAHADGIIHLAGMLGTQETIQNPLPSVHTNMIGGLNVLEAASEFGLPAAFITVGNHWMNNTYSITKSTMERFADMYNRYRKGKINVVRATNCYGPRQAASTPYGPSKVRKIIPSLACRALSLEPIEIYGDGEQISDMVWAGDLATILVNALEHAEKFGPVGSVLEAGLGERISVNVVASLVAYEAEKITGKRVEIKHIPMRPGEDLNSVVLADPQTLLKIDYDPLSMLPLNEGLMRTVAYYARYLAGRQ